MGSIFPASILQSVEFIPLQNEDSSLGEDIELVDKSSDDVQLYSQSDRSFLR